MAAHTNANQRKLGVHHLIRAGISLGFAIFIAYLVKADYMTLYIAPRMTFIVKLSAIALYLIGIYELFSAYRSFFGKRQHSHDCASCDNRSNVVDNGCACGDDHAHEPKGPAWKHVVVYGLFVFPLLLGTLLPNVTMGSAIAAKKGMNLSASTSGRLSAPISDRSVDTVTRSSTNGNSNSSSVQVDDNATMIDDKAAIQNNISDAELDQLFEADVYTEDFARLAKELYRLDVIEVREELFMEVLTAMDIFVEPFQGQKVEISGFVYREPDMKDNQFVIGRFAMDCCSADALPYGVLVEYDNAKKYANDTWLKLRGTISKTMYRDLEIMMFAPDTLTEIATPASPYVYPNYDF